MTSQTAPKTIPAQQGGDRAFENRCRRMTDLKRKIRTTTDHDERVTLRRKFVYRDF